MNSKFFSTFIRNVLLRILTLKAGTGRFTHNFTIERDVMVPMRDGIRLSTDIYIPDGKGPFPVVLTRLPYGKSTCHLFAEIFARYGYVFVLQDTRGKFDSEGDYYPFIHEQEDGRATTEWIIKQPWCNGKIGTFGISYLGYTQWALAPGNPNVTALAPMLTSSNIYNLLYWGGSFLEMSFLNWALAECGRKTDINNLKNIYKAHESVPLIEKDRIAFRDVPYYKDWINHPVPDDYWSQINIDSQLGNVSTPAFLVAGWYDIFNGTQLKDFELLKKSGNKAAAEGTRILIGPWNHGFSNRKTERAYGIKRSRLELFPLILFKELKEWYDYWLKGIGVKDWNRKPPVKIYVLGENRWRDEMEWPPARTRYTEFYLHSNGNANTRSGDGRLDTFMPSASEKADTYVYDPGNPVPTVGGSNLVLENSGPMDQSAIEDRRDVLVYSTEPLKKELEVTGPVWLTLYASSSAVDTDFTAKLVDVAPNGRAFLICDGILRARYRNGLHKPELMEAGKIYKFDIFLGNTSVLFKKGHRIRLEVSSSNFPRYDRNTNTGTDIATETRLIAAQQTIYHEEEYPSRLILPVNPRR